MSHVDEGKIHAYLDNQLEYANPNVRREFEEHISYCVSCAALFEETRGIHGKARELLETATPEGRDAPSFEAIIQRAQGDDAFDPKAPAPAPLLSGPQGVSREHRWAQLRGVGLAATIILALAVGWYARMQWLQPGDSSSGAPAAAADVQQIAQATTEQPETQSRDELSVNKPPADNPQLMVEGARSGEQAAGRSAGQASANERADMAKQRGVLGGDRAEELRARRAEVAEPRAFASTLDTVAVQRRQNAPSPAVVDSLANANAAAVTLEAEVNREAERFADDALAGANVTSVSGRVVDEDTNVPLEGAQITVVGTTLSGRTNASGEYRIDSVPTGPVQLSARFIGFALGDANAIAEGRLGVQVDFALPRADLELDEVVVAAPAPDPEPARRVQDARASIEAAAPPVRELRFVRDLDAGWLTVTVAQAESRLGAPVMIVQGLPIDRVQAIADGPQAVVVVTQRLTSGGRLELTQSQPYTPAAGKDVPDAVGNRIGARQTVASSSAIRIVGGIQIVLRGEISRAELAAMLDRLVAAPTN